MGGLREKTESRARVNRPCAALVYSDEQSVDLWLPVVTLKHPWK